ncbi:MAG: ABC transporter substrate-binding protein [Rhodospirillaceae bacterium]|nr:ABC transporter substrate-binding protein [Rhodospirillaceae bacterium]
MKYFFILFMELASLAAQAQTARIAVDTLPLSQGNPFRTSLAPTIYATAAVFDALARFDDNAILQPALAIKWDNIDPLTWRFYLRPSVVFSNGAPFTSDAVVNAVAYLTSDSAAKDLLKRELSILKSARAIDDLTVDIVTTEPVPFFPRYMTALPMVEPNHWRKLGRDEFARQPVGTGPFKVDKIETNRWALSKFAASWHPAKIERLEILMLPDGASRVQALEGGRVDISLVIGPDNIGAIEAMGGRVKNYMVSSAYGITFITTRGGPFTDVRVRRAINMGVNRERIVNQLMAGRTVPANQPASRSAFGYNPDIPQYPYDPTAAKKLLAEAGFANGLSFVLDAPNGASAGDTSVFQQVQSDLREIGVIMDIKMMPNTLYLNKTTNVDFTGDAFPIAWPAWPILDVWRALQIHSCFRPVKWFCEESLTPKMREALSEWDEAKALKLRQEIGQAYHDLAPAIFLYELPLFVGLSDKVKNFSMFSNLIAYDQLEVSP